MNYVSPLVIDCMLPFISGNTYPMGYQQPPPNYNQATVYPQGSAQQPNYPPPPGAMYGDPAYPPEYKQ